MTRAFLAIALAVFLSGCNRAPENRDAVRQGVVEHLSRNAALDMNQLDVEITDVKFQGNEATAAVAIRPKTTPDQGMTMSYTLERRGEKWQVRGRGAGHGGGMGAATPPPQTGGGELPTGHPPVNSQGGTSQGGGRAAGELPAGHPPVNSPAPQK